MDKFWYPDEEIKPDLDEDLLMHYGVKGMKWRHHNRNKRSSKKVYRRKNSPMSNLYDEYGDWYENTKFGKFMTTPITELFKPKGTEAEAGPGKKYVWMKDPVTGLDTKMSEKDYATYSARRRHQTNQQKSKASQKKKY